METFSTLLALCEGIHRPPVFPSQRLAIQSFDVFFDLRLNKRSSKQSCSCARNVAPSYLNGNHDSFALPHMVVDIQYVPFAYSTVSGEYPINHIQAFKNISQWSTSSLLQAVACCLFSAKPLPEVIVTHWWLDPWEQISNLNQNLHMLLKTSCAKCQLFRSVLDVAYLLASANRWRFNHSW